MRMSASASEQCGNGTKARRLGSVEVLEQLPEKGAREAHERCHEADGTDLPREGQQGPGQGRGPARDA
ncbi:hypothetical protein SBRY_20796 [Actinacidiphila bryophytorum]|uniref:Uncharacterized protein n=1 Tax=Actinacidiphila bryophytorum TaxID=1436133 RepID=A0A9W4E824_9ACTN|nr:hypothetical protein SBRY_20796 [Actinacidiphila bryophytorum]